MIVRDLGIVQAAPYGVMNEKQSVCFGLAPNGLRYLRWGG